MQFADFHLQEQVFVIRVHLCIFIREQSSSQFFIITDSDSAKNNGVLTNFLAVDYHLQICFCVLLVTSQDSLAMFGVWIFFQQDRLAIPVWLVEKATDWSVQQDADWSTLNCDRWQCPLCPNIRTSELQGYLPAADVINNKTQVHSAGGQSKKCQIYSNSLCMQTIEGERLLTFIKYHETKAFDIIRLPTKSSISLIWLTWGWYEVSKIRIPWWKADSIYSAGASVAIKIN